MLKQPENCYLGQLIAQRSSSSSILDFDTFLFHPKLQHRKLSSSVQAVSKRHLINVAKTLKFCGSTDVRIRQKT